MSDINLLPNDQKAGSPQAAAGPGSNFNLKPPALTRTDHLKVKPSAPKTKLEPPKRDLKDQSGVGVNFIKTLATPSVAPAVSKKKKFWGVLILAELIVIGAGYFGFSRYLDGRRLQISELAEQEAKIGLEIKNLQNLKELAVKDQKKLQGLKDLFGQHLYWTNFFEFIEENTLPEIIFQNANVDASRVTLTARANKLSDISKQIVAFNQFPELISSVNVRGINLVKDEEGDRKDVYLIFNLDLTLQPKLLQFHD